MRKPVVDYRKLRPNNLTSPEYRHLLYLLGWVGYFILYVLTEKLIPAGACYPVHSPLDDLIPFNEWFLIPYCFWYVLIVISLGWFALYNTRNFKNLQTYIIITQVVAMTVYILLPSRQDLRPEQFARDNFLTHLAAFIYDFDTNTGVCPSLHVAYSLGILSCWLRERSVGKGFKVFVTAAVVLICISVTFVKQHSVLDILAALPLGLLAEWLTFAKASPINRTGKKKEQKSLTL